MAKDIFISYKNDGSGNKFAARLSQDLENFGYSVYFNSREEHATNFPERLRTAVEGCKDFILVLSKGCLEQLKRNDSVDWIREEVLTAKRTGKHIIPILIENAALPKDADEMPEELRFLPHIDALSFPEQYLSSPFSELQHIVYSKQVGKSKFRDEFNSNPEYDISADYQSLFEKANAGDIQAMYEFGMMCF